jgi:F-type H+-transporting ATPase subunit delta
VVEITGTGGTGLTARYAAALYAAAFERGTLDEVVAQMAELGRLIHDQADLRALLANPLLDSHKVAPALAQALESQGFSPLIRNFVQVAAGNRRLRDLPRLVDGFTAYVAAKRGEIVAEVTTAHGLSDLQRSQLHARLTESGHRNAKLIERQDPSLLGGMVVKIGSKLYDTSLKSRLQRLNYSLKGAA